MKSTLFSLSIVLFASCGGREQGSDATAAPDHPSPKPPAAAAAAASVAPAQGEITDERIGLPIYPGATEVEYSRVKLHMNMGDTFSVAYRTTDTPTQVADFYRAQTASLGTAKPSIATSDLLKTLAVDRTDGTQSVIKAMGDNKGSTIITIHRFFPKK
jgi:hypothetical protein